MLHFKDETENKRNRCHEESFENVISNNSSCSSYHRAGGRELEIVIVIVCCFQGVESDAESYKHLVIACKEAIQKFECPVKKALDIMCSVGRFSYELSKHFDEVT